MREALEVTCHMERSDKTSRLRSPSAECRAAGNFSRERRFANGEKRQFFRRSQFERTSPNDSAEIQSENCLRNATFRETALTPLFRYKRTKLIS